jgi:hypothetical protein
MLMVDACKYAFAGKPRSYRFFVDHKYGKRRKTCRRERAALRLAREGVGTNDTNPGNDKGHPKVAFVW